MIPRYNETKYLWETVEWVLKQTHPPLEVIVVDDASKTEIVRGHHSLSLKLPRVDCQLFRRDTQASRTSLFTGKPACWLTRKMCQVWRSICCRSRVTRNSRLDWGARPENEFWLITL